MNQDLNGKTVAVLATDGYEQSELERPLDALKQASATVHIVSPNPSGRSIRGWDEDDWGDSVSVDVSVEDADADDYDALVLPGGVMNPDSMRTDEGAVAFVRAFFEQGKPVAAICHAPWMLVEADVLDGRTLTSWPSLRTDIENAGATWVDREVVVDEGLVTSRNPGDLPAFCDKMLEEIREGRHAGQTA